MSGWWTICDHAGSGACWDSDDDDVVDCESSSSIYYLYHWNDWKMLNKSRLFHY